MNYSIIKILFCLSFKFPIFPKSSTTNNAVYMQPNLQITFFKSFYTYFLHFLLLHTGK